MADVAVELRDVSKRYSGHVAVDGLSLSVPRGVVYGLLGPNGAGKTTTIRMINDIVKPDAGRITLFGDLAPGARAQQRIGYLPEERGLYPRMTVRRVLTFLAELRGMSRAEAAPRIASWIDRLELGKWIDAKVESLSKGMQQKVQFIGAVVHEPDLLILDEPFTGLDPINADVLRAIVRGQKMAGKTILFSTHLMEHADQICDAVCILARAKSVLEGTLERVKAEARDRRNAWRVEVSGSEHRVEDVFAKHARAAARDGRGWEVELPSGEDGGALLRALLDEGCQVLRFERHVPTLHEIFVERVRAAPGEVAS